MRAEAEPRPGYNHHSETVEISAQDRRVGPKIYDLFTKRLIRPLPWDIKNGKIEVYKRFDAFAGIIAVLDEDYKPDVREKVIITTGLEKERISPGLARTIAQHKVVEDFLRDFMRHGTDTTRNNMGLSMANLQWGREELQHGLALGLILEKTGNKTAEEIVEDYLKTLEHSWEAPFPTEREIVMYASIQEPFTGKNYGGMAKQALIEEAPTVAAILTLIEEDENYHGGGYRSIAKIYYEDDPDGARADAIHVAKNFEMPLQHIIPNRIHAMSDLMKYTGFDIERKPKVIQNALRGFGFLSEKEIQEVVQGHLKG